MRTLLLWLISIGLILLLGCIFTNQYNPSQYELPRIAIPWMLGCMVLYYISEPFCGRR